MNRSAVPLITAQSLGARGGGGGGGVMNSPIAPIGIARRMILAIVTSRENLSRELKMDSASEIVSWFQEVKVETLR